jgi:hypothetical protein
LAARDSATCCEATGLLNAESGDVIPSAHSRTRIRIETAIRLVHGRVGGASHARNARRWKSSQHTDPTSGTVADLEHCQPTACRQVTLVGIAPATSFRTTYDTKSASSRVEFPTKRHRITYSGWKDWHVRIGTKAAVPLGIPGTRQRFGKHVSPNEERALRMTTRRDYGWGRWIRASVAASRSIMDNPVSQLRTEFTSRLGRGRPA